jgi:penicillin-binding protein-related factor A (putative recombinase)
VPRELPAAQSKTGKSFLLLFFKKEESLFFFEKKNQKTFIRYPLRVGSESHQRGASAV